MPQIGYKQTKEHKKHLKENHADFSGKKHPFYGKKHTKAAKEKQKQAILERFKNGMPESIKKKIKKNHAHLSGERHPLFGKRGKDSPNFGSKRSKETIEKMSGKNNSMYGRIGNKNPLWIEDRSLFIYPTEWTDILKEAIRKRDKYICQECGVHQDELEGWNKKLDVHHVDYAKKNCDLNNLITLCRFCHIKTNYNREKWKKYFQSLPFVS